MRATILALVLGLAACWSTSSDDGSDCFGVRRIDQDCVFQPPGIAGYECAKLKYIRMDGRRLSDFEVAITCGATDATSEIRITLNDATVVCTNHFLEACVE